MFIHSFCVLGVRCSWCILVSSNLKAASLCSYGWLDVKWITVSVIVGFLYLNFNAYTISVNKKVQKVYGAVFFLYVWLNVKLLCMELACCRISTTCFLGDV